MHIHYRLVDKLFPTHVFVGTMRLYILAAIVAGTICAAKGKYGHISHIFDFVLTIT